MGKILSINISSKKGTPKSAVEKAYVVADFGVRGDVHAGSYLRQVSLLSWEAIQSQVFCPKTGKSGGEKLKPGDFAENITTEGVDLTTLRIGDKIKLGQEVLLQVTKIGKKCHTFCEIYKKVGKCIMPEQGIFTRVLEGGWVKKGDSILLIKDEDSYCDGK